MIGIDRSAFTPKRVVLVGRPVETGHADHLAAAGAADHDVVAALADELVEAAVAEEHVVAVDAVLGEDFVEIVARCAVEGAGFDPVVTLVAEDAFGVLVAEDEVVAFAGEDFRTLVGSEEDEVVTGAAQNQVETRTGMDNVVAGAGLDVVVAADVLDDVVAVAAIDDVVAEAALEVVVAAIAEQRVVADTRDENVGRVGAAEDDVVAAGVAQIVGIRPGVAGLLRMTSWVRMPPPTGSPPSRVPSPSRSLNCRVGSTSRIRPGVENTSDGRCVALVLRMIMDGEGVVLHLAEQMQSVEPLQVVEAVAALQVFHLHFEDEVEGGAEHAAERHDLLGEAADPEIDVFEAAEVGRHRRRYR